LALVTQTLPAVAREFLRNPSLRLADLFCEVATPPLAFVVAIYGLALLWEPVRYSVGLVGIALIGLHVVLTIPVAKLPFRTFFDLALVPAYVAWKLALLPLIWARRKSKTWVRAQR
jgi:hypothetical protein